MYGFNSIRLAYATRHFGEKNIFKMTLQLFSYSLIIMNLDRFESTFKYIDNKEKQQTKR